MNEQSNAVELGKDPCKTIKEVLDRLENVKMLVYGLIASVESSLQPDDEDENKPITGAEYFIVNHKVLLSTFGDKISDEFAVLTDFINGINK